MAKSKHWERELAGKLNARDITHEAKERFGVEVKEHGLKMQEAENALVHEQHKKYLKKENSKFHI